MSSRPSSAVNSPHILVINTGSLKKKFIFEVARSLGLEVSIVNRRRNWGVEYARRFLTVRTRKTEAILGGIRRLHQTHAVNGVATFWEEDVPMAALASRAVGCLGLPLDVAWACRSKYLMRKRLADQGVAGPKFARVFSLQEALQALKDIGTPAVIKPEYGADSECVVRIDSEEDLRRAFRDVLPHARVQEAVYPYEAEQAFVLESYLSGREVSVEGVVQEGRPVLYAIIDKAAMQEPFFIERGECTPSRLPRAQQDAIRAMVVQAARALGMTDCGLHAEVKCTPEGPRIVEIGARMGGDCIHRLVKAVYGIDLVQENLRVCLGRKVSDPRPANGVGVSTTLVPETGGRVAAAPVAWAKQAVQSDPRLIEVVCTKATGDTVLVPPDGYDNLAWVSIHGKTWAEADQVLGHYVHQLLERFQIVTAGDDLARREAGDRVKSPVRQGDQEAMACSLMSHGSL